MASTGTAKRAPIGAETTATRVNKGGRPRGSSKPTAGPQPIDYTKYRQSISKFPDFWKYLEGYPEKSGLWAYFYRLRPRLDLGLAGFPNSYIWKTSKLEEMTEDFIATKFGSGEYQLKLTDMNRVRGEQEVCKTWIIIDDPELKPIYDPRSLLLGDEKNSDEVARLLQAGVLIRDSTTGLPRLRTDSDPAGPVNAQAAFGHGAQGPTLSGDVLGQIVLGMINRNTQSPAEMVQTTIQMANLLRQPQIDVEAIIERVAARLQPQQNGGGGDIFQAWERVESMFNKFRPVAGQVLTDGDTNAKSGNGSGGFGAWAPHVTGILAQARAMIPEIVAGVKALRVDRVVSDAGHNGQQMPNQNQPPRILPFQERLQAIAQMGLEQMDTGTKGFDFATWVCLHFPGGLEVYRWLEPNGTDGLIAMLAMQPQTKHLTTDPARRAQLEVFLNDFFEFDTGKLDAELAAASGTPPAVVNGTPAPGTS